MPNPEATMGSEDRDLMVWPDVIAATVMGDGGRYFAEVSTNNNETPVKMYIYWHVPSQGPPVLMIEIDDDAESSDIYLRVRRNDGLVAQGTPDEMQYLREEP